MIYVSIVYVYVREYVCVCVCPIEKKKLTGSGDIQTDYPCVYVYNSAFTPRPMKCPWKSGNKPLKLT